jgi:hypothetical protein
MAVGMGKRVFMPLPMVGACLLLLLAAPSPAAAAGKTFYASPTGTGAACTTGARCQIGEAIAKAGDGDSVSLAAGNYSLPFTGLTIDKEIDVGTAVPGGPAVLQTTQVADIHVPPGADPRLHDLRIEGEGGLRLSSGAAERVFVAYVGVMGDACELEKGTVLRDSVCWTLEATEEEEGVSHAIAITAGGENQDEPVVLRNVTAIANNASGDALHAVSSAGAELTVDAANVIARSENGTDVVAELITGGFPKAHVSITNSNFATVADAAPDAAVTPIGTSGNISAPPTFVNPATGDFHVGGDSPTLDGGVADLSVGILDLDGHDRLQSKCFGTAAVPDMGAYERTPTDNCPPPPPPPPPPFEPRKPVFRILSLVLNKKTGAGRLLVEVPGAGTLSLTGSGVKLVRRTAPGGGGVITLPIQTWAITKVRLAKVGKTKVRLKVIFESRAGGVEEWSKGVILRKKTS